MVEGEERVGKGLVCVCLSALQWAGDLSRVGQSAGTGSSAPPTPSFLLLWPQSASFATLGPSLFLTFILAYLLFSLTVFSWGRSGVLKHAKSKHHNFTLLCYKLVCFFCFWRGFIFSELFWGLFQHYLQPCLVFKMSLGRSCTGWNEHIWCLCVFTSNSINVRQPRPTEAVIPASKRSEISPPGHSYKHQNIGSHQSQELVPSFLPGNPLHLYISPLSLMHDQPAM